MDVAVIDETHTMGNPICGRDFPVLFSFPDSYLQGRAWRDLDRSHPLL